MPDSTKLRVVLTGATGKLGSSVLNYLLTLIPHSSIIISLYNPTKRPAEGAELEIREGNFHDPASLDKAYAGADILFLMSYPSLVDEIRIPAHRNALEAAKRSSIKHIIYTSLAFGGGPTSTDSVAGVMQAHLHTESYLKTNLPPTMTYTILREGLYTEAFGQYLGIYDLSQIPPEVSIPPGDNGGLIAFTKRDELGEATAKIIKTFVDGVKDNEFTNRTILLAAEPRHSLRSTTELIAQLLKGKPFSIKYVSLEEYVDPGSEAMKFFKTPEIAKAWATTFPAIGRGETSFTGEGSKELERILGRKPESVEATLARFFQTESLV